MPDEVFERQGPEVAAESRRRQHVTWYAIAVLAAVLAVGVIQLFFR